MEHDKLLTCIHSVFARKHQQARKKARTSHALELVTMILRWTEEELLKNVSKLKDGNSNDRSKI